MFPKAFRLYMKKTGPVHLPKQPPSVDRGYSYNNDITECTVPCNEASHINYVRIYQNEACSMTYLMLPVLCCQHDQNKSYVMIWK